MPTSPIKRFFPDYDGPVDDIEAGKQYFKRRFTKLAYKSSAIQSHNQKTPDPSKKKKSPGTPRVERRLYPQYVLRVIVFAI